MSIAFCKNCGKVKAMSEMMHLGYWFCDEKCRIEYIQLMSFKPIAKQGQFVPFDYEHERKQYDE